MQQQDTNVVTTSLPFGFNRSLTLGNSIVSHRPVLSNTTTSANRTQRLANSTKSVATRGHVRWTPKQSTNLARSPLAFGNSKRLHWKTLMFRNLFLQTPACCNTITTSISSRMMPNSSASVVTRGQQVTLVASTRKRQSPLNDVSKVSQSFVLCNTINHDNSSTLGRNSSPTSCNQVTLVDQACKDVLPQVMFQTNMFFYNNIHVLFSNNLSGSSGRSNSKHPIDQDIMNEVKDVLDTSSDLVKTFRRARDWYNEDNEQNIRIKLVAKRGRDGRTSVLQNKAYKPINHRLGAIGSSIAAGNTNPTVLGKPVVLSSLFTGGPRYMRQNYMDAMALCRWYGYRPDVLLRVFKMKLDQLMKDVKELRLFGRVQAATTIDGEQIQKPVDEIKAYLDCRYLSACEAVRRIFGFEVEYRTPSVERLSFYLPGEQQVLYDENSDLETILHKPSVGHSMFEGWMKMNELYPASRELTYVEFTTKYEMLSIVGCYSTVQKDVERMMK
uniref:Uncharacterized protein n=1 Tax=Tanacetum cinerariifolium TaxID=118510 RepID=A0A699H531_TANCI|nr:hypothetical protein [Tanacetum cinerariifolium]